MRVFVIGATGGTGRCVVEHALERGWQVTAFVRNPDKLTAREGLAAVAGDVADAAALERALPGHAAVISTLGQQRGSPPALMRDAAEALVTAMPRAGVKRLIALSGAGVKVPGDPDPPLMARLMMGLVGAVMPALIQDTQGYADRIRASELEWTLARPMRLLDGAGGRPLQVAPTLSLGMSSGVDRKDVARFLVDQVEGRDWLRQAPMLGPG